MTLTVDNIKLYKAANMTQDDNGGGRISGDVVIDGEINNLFGNISRIDRVWGSIDIAKCYVKVDAENTDVYQDAHVMVLEPPFDDNVDVFIMDCDDPDEVRSGIVNRLESYHLPGGAAGNAGLESDALAGSRQLVFKTLHKAYVPEYDDDGHLIYSGKIDTQYFLGVSIGDLAIIGTGDNLEYVQVQDITRQREIVSEYLETEYSVVTLSSDLLYNHSAGEVFYTVLENPGWKIYGLCRLSDGVTPEDATLPVKKTTGKLIPTIERYNHKENVPFNNPPSYESEVVITKNGQSLTIGQAKQYEISDVIPVTGIFYSHTFNHPPAKLSGITIYYLYQGGWMTAISDSSGVISGAGSGNINADQNLAVFSLSQQPDADGIVLIQYTRKHQYEENSNSDVLAEITSEDVQVGSHEETESRELIHHVESAGANLGHVHAITENSSDTIINTRYGVLTGSFKVYLKRDGQYRLILQTSVMDQTEFDTIEPGYTGHVNRAARYIRIYGELLSGDAIHMFYKTGKPTDEEISGFIHFPDNVTTGSVEIGRTHIVPGQFTIGITGKVISPGNVDCYVMLILRDNGQGRMFFYDPHNGQYDYEGTDLPFIYTCDYDTGTISVDLSGYVIDYLWVQSGAYLFPAGTSDMKVHVIVPYYQYYKGYSDLGDLVETGSVIVDELSLATTGKVQPGTLTIYESDSESGPWETVIYSDNSSGVVSGSGEGTGLIDYENRSFSISFDNGSYNKYWRFGFELTKTVYEYETRFTAALNFGLTGLAKNGVTLSYLAEGRLLSAKDNGAGAFKIDTGMLTGDFETLSPGGYSQSFSQMISFGGVLMAVRGTNDNSYLGVSNGDNWVTGASNCTDGGHVCSCALGIFEGVTAYMVSGPHGKGSISKSSTLKSSTDGMNWTQRYGIKTYAVAIYDGVAAVVRGTESTAEICVFNTWTSTYVVGQEFDNSALIDDATQAVLSGGKDENNDSCILLINETGGVLKIGGKTTGSFTLTIQGGLPFGEPVTGLIYSEKTHVWVATNQNGGVAYSTDGGITFLSANTDAIDGSYIYDVGVNIYGLFMLVTEEGRYTSSDGNVWVKHSSIFTDGEVAKEQMSVVNHEGYWLHSYTGATSGTAYMARLFEGEPIDVDLIGTVDYEAGTGVLNAGPVPSAIRSDLFLTEKQFTEFAAHTDGAAPVQSGTFSVAATGADGSALTDADLEESTYNEKYGFVYGKFIKPYIPSSLNLSYDCYSIFHPQYDNLSVLAFTLSGEVPVVQNNFLILLSDRKKYKLAEDVTASDVTITLVDVSGFPPELLDDCVIRIGNEKMLVADRNETSLTIATRGHDSTTTEAHEKGAYVYLETYNRELLPVDTVMYDRIVLGNKLSHSYSEGAIVSSVLQKKSLYARLYDHHTQVSWDGSAWETSDSYTGDPADGAYDFAAVPIEVTNLGAESDQFILEVVSTSPVLVDVHKKSSGVIATDLPITADIAPINPNNSTPYFTLKPEGWGSNWQVGNILCIEIKGADAPMVIIRTIDARASDNVDDSAIIGTRGDAAEV